VDQKQEQSGKADNLTRRKFMRNGATATTGLAVGLGTAGCERCHGESEHHRIKVRTIR
jgi:hypothetical protein